jgi:indolepyruvate ferredoxin oxidoreductase
MGRARVYSSSAPGQERLAAAVARYAYKVMAYKDEYEVARLYTDGRFERMLAERFAGEYRLAFHLAPPLLAKRDPHTGLAVKRTFGPWMLGAMRALAKLKGLRGTPLDPFGWTAERRRERALADEYERTVDELARGLGDRFDPERYELAIAIASLPERIRGYGYVKERHLVESEAERDSLLAAWRSDERSQAAA